MIDYGFDQICVYCGRGVRGLGMWERVREVVMLHAMRGWKYGWVVLERRGHWGVWGQGQWLVTGVEQWVG